MHEEVYFPFIVNENTSISTMEEFCLREVEAFGRDADHLQIMAVCSSFRVHLKVVCLQDPDAHKESNAEEKNQGVSPCDIVSFNPDGAFLEIAPLLYRPGHFDLLQVHSIP